MVDDAWSRCLQIRMAEVAVRVARQETGDDWSVRVEGWPKCDVVEWIIGEMMTAMCCEVDGCQKRPRNGGVEGVAACGWRRVSGDWVVGRVEERKRKFGAGSKMPQALCRVELRVHVADS